MKQDPNIKKLLQKFVENNCNEDEIETIITYVKQAKGTEDFPNFDEVLQQLEELPDMDQSRSQDMYHNILKTAKHNKPEFKVRHIWRYAAAAILIIALASTYFLRDTIFNNQIQIENTTPTIVNNQIEPGIDKATLTLEDGTEMVLVKGASVQTQNATSNGEEIIYQQTTDNRQQTTGNRQPATNSLTIPRGGQFFITLADGTKVWLNSESQIKYPVAFTEGETRQIDLIYGEAYFEVSPSTEHKGSKFKVYHKKQEVEVLGTKFNIKAYKDETNIYTTLVEGKVAVSTETENQILKPSEQSNLDILNNSLQVATVDVQTQTSWKQGKFIFKKEPLKKIMKVLSRWYDIEVVFEDKYLETVIFTGVIGKDQKIEEILSDLKNTGFINGYEINNKTLTIK